MQHYVTILIRVVWIVGFLILVGATTTLMQADMAPPDTEGAGPFANPRVAMQMIVSGLMTIAALFVILSKWYPSDTQKWAYGVLGTIVGY